MKDAVILDSGNVTAPSIVRGMVGSVTAGLAVWALIIAVIFQN